jgi:hypothetical protein
MDFRASILPLYYVCKVMGLAPFSYSNKVSVHTKQKKSTKGLLSPNVLWSFFVFLIQLAGFMALMIRNIRYDYTDYTLSAIVSDALSILIMYSTCFASLVGAVFNRRRIGILMMNFTAIDHILLKENYDHVYRKTRRNSLLRDLIVSFSAYWVLLLSRVCVER